MDMVSLSLIVVGTLAPVGNINISVTSLHHPDYEAVCGAKICAAAQHYNLANNSPSYV